MKVTGSTIQQLDKKRKDGTPKPKSECRKWRLWATTELGRKSRRFEGTYSMAQNALRAFVEELEGFVPNAETFGAYAESWRLWREKSGDYSPNTVAGDKTFVGALRRTALDGMRMDAVTPDDCRKALLWLKENPADPRTDEYGASTLAKAYQALHAIMAQAVSDGKLASNPMSSVKRPKVRHEERDALSPDELALFLNRVDGLPLDGRTVAVYLMACLGLRVGEACALRDDGFAGGFARIVSTVRGADGSVGDPKSPAGKRTLPVMPRLQEKVDDWRIVRRALGFQDAETLCCNLHGGLMSTSMMENWWAAVRGSIGCEGMTLHQLRHSNLSMMARHMSVFDLQRYAGWSSIAPARIYVHSDMESVSRAVKAAWSLC